MISIHNRIDPMESRSAKPAYGVAIEIAPNAPRTGATGSQIRLKRAAVC